MMTTNFATCRKRIDCQQTVYNFDVGIKARPNLDSIFLNDTLWFAINESAELQDIISGRKVSFKNAANLSFVFGVWKVVGPQELEPGVSAFDYVLRKGKNIQPTQVSFLKEFQLIGDDNKYALEVGFVAKQRGVYRVLIERAANVYTQDNPCEKANFSVHFVETDQHFYLGYNISGAGVYYFKVH